MVNAVSEQKIPPIEAYYQDVDKSNRLIDNLKEELSSKSHQYKSQICVDYFEKETTKIKLIYNRLKTNKLSNKKNVERIYCKLNLLDTQILEYKIRLFPDYAIAKDLYNIVKGYYEYFLNSIPIRHFRPSNENLDFCKSAIETCSQYVERLEQVSVSSNLQGYKDKAEMSKVFLNKMNNLYNVLIDATNRFETEFPQLKEYKEKKRGAGL